MPNTINSIPLAIALSGTLVVTPFHLAMGAFPVCTNSTITLPGENGPEIWSCVGSSPATNTKTTQQVANTSIAQPEVNSTTPEISVEKRTDSASDSMKNEIQRVLDQTTSGNRNNIQKQFSVGAQYSSNRRNKGLRDNRGRSIIFPLGMRFQLTDRTSISATVPLIHKETELVSNNGVYNSDVFGVGDVSINATTTLLNETEKRPSLSVSVGVGAPTGKIENPQESTRLSLGSGFWTGSVGATVSKRFDPATVFASARYQHVLGDEQFGYDVQPGSSLEYSYGLGFSINSALSVSGHISGSIHSNASVDGAVVAGSNSEPLEFVSTSSLRLSKTTNLESNLAFGLNKDAGDARFGLTLTKEF